MAPASPRADALSPKSSNRQQCRRRQTEENDPANSLITLLTSWPRTNRRGLIASMFGVETDAGSVSIVIHRADKATIFNLQKYVCTPLRVRRRSWGRAVSRPENAAKKGQMTIAESEVYYNEFADFPTRWLAELVAAGAIPPGWIDGRPIQEVAASDLAGADVCHFFAGCGAWAYAVEQAGWPSSGLRTWTASLPCQPWSRAGRKAGKRDPRHLWPIFYDLVDQCRPSVILGEQISGPHGRMWLDIVFDDLEDGGYAVAAIDSPAASVGAPQIRQRQYWLAARVADTESIQRELRPGRFRETRRWEEPARDGRAPHPAGDTAGYWRDALWYDGDDGCARPIGPGLRTLAARSPGDLDALRGYGNAINAELAIAFVASAREALAGCVG